VRSQRSVRVLVVDDSARSLESLCAFLRTLEGVEIVGTAKNGIELVSRAQVLKPDLVVTDLHMPRMSGLECIVILREIMPATRFIVFTDLESPFTEEECRKSGADFYIYKEHMPEKIKVAMRQLFPNIIEPGAKQTPPAKHPLFC